MKAKDFEGMKKSAATSRKRARMSFSSLNQKNLVDRILDYNKEFDPKKDPAAVHALTRSTQILKPRLHSTYVVPMAFIQIAFSMGDYNIPHGAVENLDTSTP